jgi:hypothetical protein
MVPFESTRCKPRAAFSTKSRSCSSLDRNIPQGLPQRFLDLLAMGDTALQIRTAMVDGPGAAAGA